MARRALVLGATGLVGTSCVHHLLERAEYERITCLVRRASLPTSDRLHERVIDFDALRSADVDEADDLYCAIGTTMKQAKSREAFRRVDFEIPLAVARFAVAAGLKRIALVSSVSANPHSGTFYLKTKGELEAALADLPLRALHVLRPSILLGERHESRTGEAIGKAVARVTSGLWFGGLRKWKPIDADCVGRAMVGAMLAPDPTPALQVYEHEGILTLAERG